MVALCVFAQFMSEELQEKMEGNDSSGSLSNEALPRPLNKKQTKKSHSKLPRKTSASGLGSRSTHGSISTRGVVNPRATMEKMSEFSGEASIYESQSLILPGETEEISSDHFETLPFDQSLQQRDENEVTETERRERKRRRIKELKESHAEMKKLSAIGQEDSMISRYEKLSSIKDREAAADPLVGTVLDGRYEIVGIVGKGANATVYKALRLWDEKVVAIKTLRNKGAEELLRFNLEIEIIQKLKHKNLVEYIDCVRLDQQNIFLVMELIKGISLYEILKIHGPILDEETVWIMLRQVSDALKFAHGLAVIHRDLKASNVVLAKLVNQALNVKVLDFGLAKHDKSITRHGITLGSPLYMSPEQCRGDEPSVQSDIYSLGIMTYQIVAGVVPFIGETITEVMAAHCDPNITHIPIAEVYPDLGAVHLFDRLLYKSLSTRTAYRYSTVEEFQHNLDLWIVAVRDQFSENSVETMKPDL